MVLKVQFTWQTREEDSGVVWLKNGLLHDFVYKVAVDGGFMTPHFHHSFPYNRPSTALKPINHTVCMRWMEKADQVQ